MSASNILIGTLNDSSLRVDAFSSFVTPANYPNFEEFFRKVGKLSVIYREQGHLGRRVIAYHRLVLILPGLAQLESIGEFALAEKLLENLIEVLSNGLAKVEPGVTTRDLDLPSVRKLRRIQQWVVPFLPRKDQKTLRIWKTSFESTWIQGLLIILVNLDLYLIHQYIKIFPHSWGFIQEVLRWFIFHNKGAKDIKTSLTSQFETLKACLLPDNWEDLNVDEEQLKLRFEVPVHKDLEKTIAKLILFPDPNWLTSVSTFRRQLDFEKKKSKTQPCHWIHSNCGITVQTLREWGKTCWNPQEQSLKTNRFDVEKFRSNQFLTLETPSTAQIPNPFNQPKVSDQSSQKERRIRRNYFREKDRKRVKNEGRIC